MNIPRSEYPRPQFVREDWLCLNGQWQFEIDHANTGFKRGMLERELKDEITVPFCPESELSGIGYTDFMDAVWYRREVEIPQDWAGRKVLLNFQAVDYDATVWVNGTEVARHRGGWCGFTCDLEGVAKPGEKATIVVRARDLKDEKGKTSGKQSTRYENYECFYIRTTGIWQSVWMEPVSEAYLNRAKITPDVSNSKITVEVPAIKATSENSVRFTLKDDSGEVATKTLSCAMDFTPKADLVIPEDKARLWCPKDPFLYDLTIELLGAGGEVVDKFESYAGLRSTSMDGMAAKLNGKVVFQRQVLDQGYYADGIMTAPSEEALIKDIELSLEAGFNSARLHQKVFEERFLYHCDRLGYLVWGEFGDWGIDAINPKPTYITQWLEVLQRDFSHPAIIGWCGLNETVTELGDELDALSDLTLGMFLAAKAMDTTRPVIDVSGHAHRLNQTDIYDSHNYEQDPAKFKQQNAGLPEGKPFVNPADYQVEGWTNQGGKKWCVPYKGQPYYVSEFGGTWWNPEEAAAAKMDDNESWGYGGRPRTIEEVYERFEGLCDVLLDDENMLGYCYTQLTDVFQEQNGVFFFDRSNKFDLAKLRKIQQKEAAIEKKYNK